MSDTIATQINRAVELGVDRDDIPSDVHRADIDAIVADAEVKPAIGRTLVTPGSAGPEVRDLCLRLHKLGYDTTVTTDGGSNPFNLCDQSVVTAVRSFQADHDVVEDVEPSLAGLTVVGAKTWAALIRATD